jgi:hypothetical protein
MQQQMCQFVMKPNWQLVAFCDEAKVASIILKHVATNVATPNRKDSAKCGYKPVKKKRCLLPDWLTLGELI